MLIIKQNRQPTSSDCACGSSNLNSSKTKAPSLRCLYNFEVRHPRCVGSITKNFCVLHNTVEHNYISSSSNTRTTTTCFGRICGPSSGCDLTFGEATQDTLNSVTTRSLSPHPTPTNLKEHPIHLV